VQTAWRQRRWPTAWAAPSVARERSALLLHPHLPDGLISFEQGLDGVDLPDALFAGEYQPALPGMQHT
jgi:hypothetical protein